jgi:hypothetical protein
MRPLTEGEVERLRDEFVIEFTYNSNAIEGSTLTLKETAMVLEGLTVDQRPLKDHIDAVGHRDAFLYVQDIATNNVLRQLKGSREIEPGVMIESESVIDLVVGLNSSDNETYVPDVIGLKQMGAVDAVHSNSLNISKLRFDKTVKDYDDSLDAVVYKQTPEPSEHSVSMGDDVTLYLTVDTNKVPVRQ